MGGATEGSSSICKGSLFWECKGVWIELIGFRFVTRLKNVSEEEELGFTMDMINTNFSNYSAWHNRRCERIINFVVEFGLY